MAMNKKDEDEVRNPFFKLEKSSVLQEARKFNEMPIKPQKCALILAKILYLLHQGETFQGREATETFFAMTKLFQCQDTLLRKMVYLAIKGMAKIADDVIIVTSSLTKDMTGKNDAFRASAIRALCAITEPAMLQSMERYFKQSLVDRSPAVASAALVSSLHLMKDNAEVVKRWVNEVQQALNSAGNMVQYHALGLLYQIKLKDRLAVSKLVTTQMQSGALRSPHATCLLIRYAVKVLEQDPTGDGRAVFDFLEACLRNKHEMVIYEAARAIVSIPNVAQRDLSAAISVLQLFLSSPKPTLRFAAVRTLNKVAMTHPTALKTCNLDMETLITDSNRSIATLAITTLLKTGNEASVDRLMKQITSFLSEISDEFKIVVVDAIQALCLKFPKKHTVMMNFLAGVLRDEGGFEYKRAVVETFVNLIDNVPEAKDAGLDNLCEFIEDCEFTSLLVRILHVLGEHGPRTPQPRHYIRFIYNRLILENSTVRAAAVSALARFGAQVEALRPNVVVLLRRCLADSDDEVRDRATFYVKVLEAMAPATVAKYLINGFPVSVAGLERALVDYSRAPTATPFDLKTVPIEAPAPRRDLTVLSDMTASPEKSTGAAASGASASAPAAGPSQTAYAQQLSAVPQFASFGKVFKSSAPAALTEAETEYVVQCVRHAFPRHMVLQFNLVNTLNDQVLENVRVVLDELQGEAGVVSVPAPKVAYNEPAVAYVAFPLDPSSPAHTFTAKLEFVVKDCDPETGEVDEEGYPDTYSLEDVEVTLSDVMLPVNKPNFAAAWDALESAHTAEDTYELSSMADIADAVSKLCGFLGMHPCEKSDKVVPDKSTHVLYLSGVYLGGHEVLARARLAFDEVVKLQLTVRSSDEEVCTMVASAVG